MEFRHLNDVITFYSEPITFSMVHASVEFTGSHPLMVGEVPFLVAPLVATACPAHCRVTPSTP